MENKNDKIIGDVLKELAYSDKGGGVITAAKRSLAPGSRYLFVGIGGTGCLTLENIKKVLKQMFPPAVYEEYVRILAVDSAVETSGMFDPNECYILPNEAARQLVTTDSPYVQSWMNPGLKDLVKKERTYLNGEGASAVRQLGRLLLSAPSTVDALSTKIANLARQLVAEHTDRLRVFVIFGVSGGTGSGCVIDLSYLIHHALKQTLANDNYQVDGICLLPPTGVSTNTTEITDGNRNGYAACKEIENYMHVVDRGESFQHRVGNKMITVNENIFSIYYVLDGMYTNMTVSKPREKAVTTVAGFILDLMSSSIKDPNGQVRAIDSELSDAPTKSMTAVSNAPSEQLPREASYSCTAIGSHATVFPLDLFKNYVAKGYLDAFYAYVKGSEVKSNQVNAYLKQVLLKPEDFNEAKQVSKVKRSAMELAKTEGPYYVINLLNEAAAELRRRADKLEPHAWIKKNEKKILVYHTAAKEMKRLNNNLFEVFTQLLEGLKAVMEEGYSIFVDSELQADRYTFMPIKADKKAPSAAVKYLDELVEGLNIRQEVEELMEQMLADESCWNIVDGHSNAAGYFRGYWNKKLNELVKANLEDLIVKHYCKDASMGYHSDDPSNKEKKAMQKAASEIVEQTFGEGGHAKVLANLDQRVPVESFFGQKVLLVPSTVPHLKAALEAEISAKGLNVIVADSNAEDTISAYSMYTGLPMFLYKWTERGEADYEQALKSLLPGLHLSETSAGRNWANLPALMPTTGIFGVNNLREKAFLTRAQRILSDAKTFGLAEVLKDEATGIEYTYRLFTMEDSRSAAELYELLKSRLQTPDFATEGLRTVLEAAGIMFRGEDMISSKTVKTDNNFKGDWSSHLAAAMLRKKVDFMERMEKTNSVMRELIRLFEEDARNKTQMQTFAACLICDMFHYEPALCSWTYLNNRGTQAVSLMDMEIDNIEMETAQYYFLFKAFSEHYEEVMGHLERRFELAYNGQLGESRQDQIRRIRDRNAKAQALVDGQLKDILDPYAETGSVSGRGFKDRAARRGFDVEAIVSFYEAFLEELELHFNVSR